MSMKFVPMLTLLLPLLHTLHALLSGEKRLIILKKYYSCLMKFLKSICHDIMAIVTCTRSWHLFFSHRWHSRTHHSISLKSVCGARCEHLTATSCGPLCGISTTFTNIQKGHFVLQNLLLRCHVSFSLTLFQQVSVLNLFQMSKRYNQAGIPWFTNDQARPHTIANPEQTQTTPPPPTACDVWSPPPYQGRARTR